MKGEVYTKAMLELAGMALGQEQVPAVDDDKAPAADGGRYEGTILEIVHDKL